MNPVTFSNPAIALLNKVALNPQPLPPGERAVSRSLWGGITGPQYSGNTGGGLSRTLSVDDDWCGTHPPRPFPWPQHGPSFPNISLLQGAVQFQG